MGKLKITVAVNTTYSNGRDLPGAAPAAMNTGGHLLGTAAIQRTFNQRTPLAGFRES